ncbi:hypothetical protein C6P40_003357 [Pichia californica]|uniref:Orc1-like AAA ATPase domain-containing protein n=1 Tax=Pichia californica TaxID=460514 RepID=A0A9P7BEY0_9ASCO|nr:hypothetical protein C6P40_003357 [[Candida] californica]
MISEDIINSLKKSCKYKENEIELLSYFLQPEIELMTPSLIIEGSPSSGKTYLLKKYLNLINKEFDIKSIFINCDYCYTQREILRKIHKSLMIHYELAFSINEKDIMICDSINSFPGSLKQMNKFFKKRNINKKNNLIKPIIIVLDKIDKLPRYENPGELIRCLSKLHEQDNEDLNNFCFISVVTRCDFLDIGTSSIPTIKFQNYELNEFKNIIYLQHCKDFWNIAEIWKKRREIETEEEDEEEEEEEEDDDDEEEEKDTEVKVNKKIQDKSSKGIFEINKDEKDRFFRQFVDMILDTYSSYIGLSLEVVIPILRKIWPIFIDPIIKKGKIIKGLNDAFTIFMINKKLFSEEFSVVTKLDNSDSSILENKKENQIKIDNDDDNNDNNNDEKDVEEEEEDDDENKKGHYDLSIKTKYLVIAAFLASYNEPKYDRQFFSKSNQYRSSSIIKHRQKRIKISDKGDGKLRRDMSAALPFPLERLLAILNSIWVENVGDSKLLDDVELMSEIATLSSLKTLIKLKNGNTIDGQTKWKCNVHWNVVKKFAIDVGFEIENHLQE